jgi:tRNA-specific 2-thiouridylase
MPDVMVALSGGVDSATALGLLKQKGYDVIGATMLLSDHMEKAVEDAAATAAFFGVEHVVFDFRKHFKNTIIDYFIESYKAGQTPNPCIRCNAEIKFGMLLEESEKLGCRYLATGHYICVKFDEGLGCHVIESTSAGSKDQTYFLYRLKQKQLMRVLTPLGGYNKEDTRSIAAGWGLDVADKADSQEICFITEKSYKEFIRKNAGQYIKPGNYVDADNKVLGRHNGMIDHTIGQRKGLGISAGRRMYVTGIDMKKNQIILGDKESCYKKQLTVVDTNLLYLSEITDNMRVTCRIRSTMKPAPALLYNVDTGIRVVFDEPVWAPSPGQSAVFYDNQYLLGGGIINDAK